MKIFRKTAAGFIVMWMLFTCVFAGNGAKAASATTVLMTGSSGPQVVELQQKLKSLGYFNYSSITGYYGSITRDAVIRFQRSNSLYADGIAGTNTLSKLNEILSTNRYTVKSGDSLWVISLRYGTTVDRLKILNGMTTETIYPGMMLYIRYNEGSVSSSITESQNPNLYWLSRIVEAEASGEPYIGKVAVGNVILNRVASQGFPNTIKGVIFDSYQGIPQFSPVADGTIYNTPSTDSIRAAQEALNGSRPVGEAMYFFNPDKSSATWIVNNKIYVTRIGNHVFYR